MAGTFGNLPIHIADSSAPTTPASGNTLYSASGEIKTLNSSGVPYTVITSDIAPYIPMSYVSGNGISGFPLVVSGTPQTGYLEYIPTAGLLDILQNGYAPSASASLILSMPIEISWSGSIGQQLYYQLGTDQVTPTFTYVGIENSVVTPSSGSSGTVQFTTAIASISSLVNPSNTKLRLYFSADTGSAETWDIVTTTAIGYVFINGSTFI